MPARRGFKYISTRDDAVRVETMAGLGAPRDYIAKELGVSLSTLKKHYAHELVSGRDKANLAVIQSLFKVATSPKITSSRVTACIFWAKARMGWKEAQRVEHTGAEGGPIEVEDPRERLGTLVKAIQEAKQTKDPINRN